MEMAEWLCPASRRSRELRLNWASKLTSVLRAGSFVRLYNHAVIPRLAPTTALLALLQAFFTAPYQHVHVGPSHRKHGDQEESTVVHAHPYAVSVPTSQKDGPAVEHSHKTHTSVALDTFTTIAQGVPFLFFQPESPVRIFAPPESAVWVEITEPCGHDPPGLENPVPRAPPV